MRTIYRLLAGIVGGMLSLTGCGDNPFESPRAEYGSPSATFRLTGRVTDATTQEGIPGVQVRFRYAQPDTTDASGAFEFPQQRYGYYAEENLVRADDIDGPENGDYDSLELPVTFEQTAPGDGNWFMGSFERLGFEIPLTPAKPREKKQ